MGGNGRFGGYFVFGYVDELGIVLKINEIVNVKIIMI